MGKKVRTCEVTWRGGGGGGRVGVGVCGVSQLWLWSFRFGVAWRANSAVRILPVGVIRRLYRRSITASRFTRSFMTVRPSPALDLDLGGT
jgi:hypothetical protein